MISVIIPSRSPQFLKKTVEDLLNKAEGGVEVIVVLDGRWPEPHEMPPEDPRVIIIHHGVLHDNYGMRASINLGMRLASGEYVMKLDEHCMLDKGYDVKLAADCEDDWIIVPRRYRLNAKDWKLEEDGRPPVDYMYIAYPYERPFDRRCGLYGGGIDKQRHTDRASELIDETMSMQGSCYFMKKSYWDKLIGELDDVNYGPFNHEAQEVHFKAQLSGGKLMVNKKTWYAHTHKGTKGKGYGFSNEQYKKHERAKEQARRFCMNFWLLNKWESPLRIHEFKWLIDRYNPPGWPQDWETRIHEDAKKDWSRDPSKQPSEWVNSEGLEELQV